ncbi:MAG: hypothetical protein ACJA2J_002012 [Candidatus Azotimanducaceae bacterium]|jgi:hypothetical protein
MLQSASTPNDAPDTDGRWNPIIVAQQISQPDMNSRPAA